MPAYRRLLSDYMEFRGAGVMTILLTSIGSQDLHVRVLGAQDSSPEAINVII